MNVLTWILQIALGLAFIAAGIMHAGQPRDRLVKQLPWVEDFSAGTVRFVGIMEFLGGIGVILPAWTGVAPILTPIAATGLAVIMILAAATHYRRKEPQGIVVNVILLVPAVVVAWSRFGPYAY